ncbi:MAG: DUF2064 domain-containing protein [Armatimonadetes bacterium]|nr:DUF2064 domain-containing protein [Armatimonadota bacterium]
MYAKSPVAGRVKTRMAGGGLDAAAVARLYAAFVADLALRLADGPWRFVVQHPAGDDGDGLRGLLPGLTVEPEPVLSLPPRDLGAAMRDSIAAALASGAERVVIIGSDCPHLPRATIDLAFAALSAADLVLGPDEGGGCYLIGARRDPILLTARHAGGAVAWGRGTDHAALVRRAAEAGWPVAGLAPTFDLDTAADLAKLRRAVAQGEVDAEQLPATLGCLAGIAAAPEVE